MGEGFSSKGNDRETTDGEGAQRTLGYGDVLGSGRELAWPVAKLLEGAEPETLMYKSVGGNGLRLLFVKPDDWRPEDRRPAIIWIHGGGWSGGQPEQFVPHCRYAALRGAVGFSVEYRLIPNTEEKAGLSKESPLTTNMEESVDSAADQDRGANRLASAAKLACQASSVEDCLSDCIDALRFIREQASEMGVDPERIVVAGDSAGGHLSACIGTLPLDHPLGVFAIVNCNGIVDLTDKWRYSSRAPLQEKAQTNGQAVRNWFLGREEAGRLSPLQRIRPGQPPSLTLHGLLDRTVEAEQSVRYVEAHRSCGNYARLILYPRSKHAFILFGYTAAVAETMEALGDIDRFLENAGFWENDGMLPLKCIY